MDDHTVLHSMVKRGREREGEVGGFGPFHDTLLSVRTFSVMDDHTVLNNMVQGERWVDLGVS